MKKRITGLFFVALAVITLTGCTSKESKQPDTAEEVTLIVCGPWTVSKAFESVSESFKEKYPNCTVEYEYLQNYNESIVKRLDAAPETVDVFLTGNAQSDSDCFPYELELTGESNLDLSNTNDALIKNFTLKNTDELYAIPLGGELRGMYVNKTLLASLGLDVPVNATELLDACQVLKDAGYVPMNGNPGMFGQQLMYPYVCNLIANASDYETVYNKVNSCEEGVSELFREPMQFLYELTENDYYNYKYVETEYNMFIDTSDEGYARSFFNIVEDGDDYQKIDDLGKVAFMSGTLTQNTTMEKVKEDYHSAIEYEFVLAPVSENGGFAYLSPAHGIAVNKNSKNLDWSVAFLNYLFSEEGNTLFADQSHYIPDLKDSFDVIKEQFDIPENQISDLGQATFDYDFYSIIVKTMIDISKGNNPKYMDTDSNGNSILYSFDYYMNQLETDFAAQRESES